MKNKILFIMSLFLNSYFMFAQPAEFAFTPTNSSAVMYGQAQINGVNAVAGDWVAAFDSQGQCVGSSQLIINSGNAYINLTIYGDDATTSDVDEGMNDGEDFTIKIWDSSEDLIIAYPTNDNPTQFSGWTNTNGTPLPGYNDPNVIYNFLTEPPPSCTSLTSPSNGATGVNITSDLTWASVSDADGYKLTVGTTSGGTDIMNNVDVGNVTTYNPPGDFACGAQIYVTVTPYNTGGGATGCTEESFSTENVTADAGTDTEVCAGESVQLNASGGNTYSWSPTTGLSNPNISNPVASPSTTTTYTVTVSNDGRCPDSDDVLVTVNPNPIPNATATDETGNNFNDGTASSNPTSGTPTYSYSWSNGQSMQTITGLAPGNYTVTVTDSKNCTGEQTVTVNEYICPTINPNATATDETGNDFNDGTATASATGGTAPYSYSWSNGQTTQTITGLAPGNYTVTVTDSKNCTGEQTVTVNEYVCPDLTILSNIVNTQCFGSCDGSISINGVTNGVPPFTYLWSNSSTTAIINELCAGSYSVTVTDSKNCSISETFSVNQPDQLQPNATATDETGNDFEDGTATSIPSGGTSPYTYAWSNGETTQTITGLAPGNYTVTVTDAHSCTAEETVTVDEYICETLTINEAQENVSCNGDCDGSLTINSVTNGNPPYVYAWNTGGATQSIENLCPGDYDVTVTDSKNCSVSESYTITEPEVLLVNVSSTDETANDAEDGTATANPTGGTTPYSYAWSNGESTQTIENLAPGEYTVTVTDDNGCTVEATVVVAEFICPVLGLESSQLDNTCYNECDGEITITNVINGVAPFTYEWSDGQTGQTALELCAGDYDVTVTDSKNCSVVSEIFTITEPEELTAIITGTDETYNEANDGTATVNVSGGTPPYSYQWNTGELTQTITGLAPGTYNVTVTDQNGCTVEASVEIQEFGCPSFNIEYEQIDIDCYGECNGSIEITGVTNGTEPYTYNWSTGDEESIIFNLCLGIYEVTITDANNCSAVRSFEITEPDELIANASATDETANDANDGTATCTPTGGTPPYSYAWDNGENTQTITGLAPGDYTVTITDYNYCESTETVTVNEFICPALSIIYTQEDVSCFGECNGSISIDEVSDGVAPFDYYWSNGETGSSIDNLCEGSYSVTVTDDKNCEIIKSFVIVQPSELFANASSTDETYNDANDGTATANPTGGVSPYSYAWSNGENTQTITGLAPGSYTVTVTDAHGCTAIESVSVAEFGCLGLAIEISQTDVLCYSECNGTLEVTGITNGTAPFTYTWSNGETTAKIDSLCPGSYSLTIVDGNNCNVYGSYTITEPQPLSANASSTDETAVDANDGTAIANPSGGTQVYTFNWSTGDTTQTISGLSPGSYYLTVTDANGCTAFDTVIVKEFICPDFQVKSQISNISCFGLCDGSIAILNVENSTAPLSYIWNTGAISSSLNNLCAGEYSVTITDAKNCEVVQNYTLTQPEKIKIVIDSVRDVRKNIPGYIAITTNNNGNYIFSWTGPDNFTANTEDLDSLSDFGCYTLTVTDTVTNCSLDSTICLLDKTATYDLEYGNINIYPNPAKNNFIIDFNNTKLSDAEITIFDLSGKRKLIFEKRPSDKVINVKSGNLNVGLYIIRIKSVEYGTVYRKIVIKK